MILSCSDRHSVPKVLMKYRIFFPLGFCILMAILAACSAAATPTAMAATPTQMPTLPPTATFSPTSTDTPFPTATFTPEPTITPRSYTRAELEEYLLTRDEVGSSNAWRGNEPYPWATPWATDDTDLSGRYCPTVCIRRRIGGAERTLTIILAAAHDAPEAESMVLNLRQDYEPMDYDYNEWLLPEIHSPSQMTWIMIDANGFFSASTNIGQIYILIRISPIPGSDDGGGQAFCLAKMLSIQIE
jgi:hypothetical protein